MYAIDERTAWIAFDGTERIACGPPRDVTAAVKGYADAHPQARILVFDAVTSGPVELDLRGSLATVLRRLPSAGNAEGVAEAGAEPEARRSPGRPRLGVVAREVTLLPRHWEWLAKQPGGASVALRKLVEEAQRTHREADRVREARDAAFRFMNAMAGNEPGFEEATRALFAGDRARLAAIVAAWPRAVGQHVGVLAEAAMAQNGGT